MGAQLSYPTVDLTGKVAVVTGANSGIGYETAKALGVMGAHTILACRSQHRTEEAVARLREEVGVEFPGREIKVEFMPLDLSSFQSTQQFIAVFKERSLPLHILINNAGIALVPQAFEEETPGKILNTTRLLKEDYQSSNTLTESASSRVCVADTPTVTSGRTQDGYEHQFQVNHLSHFLLTLELLPSLLETASSTGDGRIIFVSAYAHKYGNVNPENMNGEQSYTRGRFYGNSKLYNVMTAFALQRRLQNVGVTVSSLHPGVVKTEITRGVAGDSKALLWLGRAIMSLPGFRTAKAGAATTINCAVNPEFNTQQCFYYADCKPSVSIPLSRDEANQEQLWEISINIVKDYLSPEVLERYGTALPTGAPSEQADQSGSPSEQADQSNELTTEGVSNAKDSQSEDTSRRGDENAEEQQHS